MQNLLDFRMAATKALYSEMACSLDAAGCEQLEQQILSAEKVSEHLDRLSEIKRNRFWPVSRGTPTPQQSALRYIDILCHLRGVHCFEQLHGRQYHHAADLQAATPLTQLGDLLRRCLQRSAPTELSMAASDGESDTDPLDRFMASIEAEVSLPHSGRAEVRQILREEPQGLADSGRPRLRPTATTSSTHLTAEGAVAEQRAAASAMAAADGQAMRGVCEGANLPPINRVLVPDIKTRSQRNRKMISQSSCQVPCQLVGGQMVSSPYRGLLGNQDEPLS